MAFELPKLAYSYGDLKPHYDAATLEIHYAKHHATYAANFAKAADAVGWQDRSAEEILADLDSAPEAQKAALTNHGGGYYNHCLFWESITPNSGGKPIGKLAEAIDAKWETFDKFKKEFSAKALSHFGSGWAWLVKDQKGELQIIDTHDQICPITLGYKPIITIDVWEHAYYLLYKNVRADWIAAWWNIANWEKAESRFAG